MILGLNFVSFYSKKRAGLGMHIAQKTLHIPFSISLENFAIIIGVHK